MNSASLAQSAYARATAIAPSDRATEYRAFAEITRSLSEMADAEATAFPKLAEALYRNNRLWTLLADDVASNNNRLPAELRARLFYLAEFTRLHSNQVLKREASVSVLVEINTAVMRGLRTRAEGA